MRRRIPGHGTKSAAPRLRPARGGALRTAKDRPKNALRVLDITRPIDETTARWVGDVPFSWRATARLVEGSLYESTCFTMSAHLGTHADAPAHVLAGGDTIGRVALEAFIGAARVVDLVGPGEVGPDRLPRGCLGVPRVLFRTWGKASLSPLAALRLVERGAILVGTDAMSIDPEDAEDLPVHRMLLARGVMLLEGLNLRQVEPGNYRLVALPLRLIKLDASPVRAILIKE